MKNKGFTLIELLIVVAIFGIIIAVVIPNIYRFMSSSNTTSNETTVNETTVYSRTLFYELFNKPITSLNLTELTFMVDYSVAKYTDNVDASIFAWWATLAELYQRQIIINKCDNPSPRIKYHGPFTSYGEAYDDMPSHNISDGYHLFGESINDGSTKYYWYKVPRQ